MEIRWAQSDPPPSSGVRLRGLPSRAIEDRYGVRSSYIEDRYGVRSSYIASKKVPRDSRLGASTPEPTAREPPGLPKLGCWVATDEWSWLGLLCLSVPIGKSIRIGGRLTAPPLRHRRATDVAAQPNSISRIREAVLCNTVLPSQPVPTLTLDGEGVACSLHALPGHNVPSRTSCTWNPPGLAPFQT